MAPMAMPPQAYAMYYPPAIPGMPFNVVPFPSPYHPHPHHIAMVPSPALSKRSADDAEADDEPPPAQPSKPKKAKRTGKAAGGTNGADGGAGGAKRGYTAKKREAAQVAAQNGASPAVGGVISFAVCLSGWLTWGPRACACV
jgi:hypothetical protein